MQVQIIVQIRLEYYAFNRYLIYVVVSLINCPDNRSKCKGVVQRVVDVVGGVRVDQ